MAASLGRIPFPGVETVRDEDWDGGADADGRDVPPVVQDLLRFDPGTDSFGSFEVDGLVGGYALGDDWVGEIGRSDEAGDHIIPDFGIFEVVWGFAGARVQRAGKHFYGQMGDF